MCLGHHVVCSFVDVVRVVRRAPERQRLEECVQDVRLGEGGNAAGAEKGNWLSAPVKLSGRAVC